jgi:Holliday junction resolvase YEN1
MQSIADYKTTTKSTSSHQPSKPEPQTFDPDSSGLEPLSNLISKDSPPLSPSKRRSKEIRAASRDGSPTPSPSRKKKILLVPSSTDGFMREVEVAENDREAATAREEGVLTALKRQGRVARWSDVSVIDLTQE